MSAKKEYDDQGRQKISCNLCGGFYHRLDVHLNAKHGITVADYQAQFPGAPTISASAKAKASRAQQGKGNGPLASAIKTVENSPEGTTADGTPQEGVYKIGVATLFKREDLTEIDKLHVPEADAGWRFDEKTAEEWEYLAVGIEENEPVYISGPTGCGKSAMVAQLAAAVNQPVLRVQLTRDFKVSQFIGRTELKLDDNGNRFTEFEDGVLPQAMKNGWWLLLDEVDQAHPDVMMALQSALEGNPLVLTENHGEVVNPKSNSRSANFRIIATANTAGKGDDTGLYAGAKVQNEATLDRYGVNIASDYPKAATEAAILKGRSGLDLQNAKKMVKVACEVREALANEECNCTFSTRRLISWAKKAVKFGDARKAAVITVLNKLDRDDRDFVNGLIQRYFGGPVAN